MKNIPQDQPVETPQPKKRRGFIRRYFVGLLVLLVVALTLTSLYFYKQSIINPNAVAQAEVQSLVQKVGRLVVLPTDETPTVATVSDPQVLKDQSFFADAKKGDKVLIYSNAKKAILYDPISDKVVTIAPLTIDPGATKTATVSSPAPTVEQPSVPKKK